MGKILYAIKAILHEEKFSSEELKKIESIIDNTEEIESIMETDNTEEIEKGPLQENYYVPIEEIEAIKTARTKANQNKKEKGIEEKD